ncbi:hypothetical protein ACWDR9_39170, partial [Streptosporangium sandarakinum]
YYSSSPGRAARRRWPAACTHQSQGSPSHDAGGRFRGGPGPPAPAAPNRPSPPGGPSGGSPGTLSGIVSLAVSLAAGIG